MKWRFADFELDGSRKTLTRRGRRVEVSGQVLDLLGILIEKPGEIVTREEIQRRLWPGISVDYAHSVDVLINRLRAALGDRAADPAFIQTVPRKGYRFTEPVRSKAGNSRLLWKRVAIYGAIAAAASAASVAFVHTRYEKFVPAKSATHSTGKPAR